MSICFYKTDFETEEKDTPEPLCCYDSNFVAITDKSVCSFLLGNFKNGISFKIDETFYDKKDTLVMMVAVKQVANFFFVFKKTIDKESLYSDIKNQKSKFNGIDRKKDSDIIPSTLSLLATICKYNPLFCFVDKEVSYLTRGLIPSELVYLFLRQEPKKEEKNQVTYVEENERNKNSLSRFTTNLIWDSVFSLFVPLLLNIFIFTICVSIRKNDIGLAITFIFISLVEPLILLYDLYTTYKKEQKYKPFSKEKFILYASSMFGILLGVLVAFFLAKNVFKVDSTKTIWSLILASSLISTGVTAIVHLVLLLILKLHKK